MEQKEITEKTKVLRADGTLKAGGWARHCLFDENTEAIKPLFRLRHKEWDFYQTSDGEWVVQLNFANIAIGSGATLSVINIKTGERYDFSSLRVLTVNRLRLASRSAESPSSFYYHHKKTTLSFEVEPSCRKLFFASEKKGKKVMLNLLCHHLENNESISVITPFRNPNQYFLTTKYNCMPTEGTITIGEKTISFFPNKTYTVLDWGRGVWQHKNYWYWSNGATEIDGKLFGYEITFGIGTTPQATETCLFYDGKAHKIDEVYIEKAPKQNGWLSPWVFKDKQGRVDLTLTPTYDNHTGTLFLGLIGMEGHQVHGTLSGKVTLDDGTTLTIDNMYTFAEYIENLW